MLHLFQAHVTAIVASVRETQQHQPLAQVWFHLRLEPAVPAVALLILRQQHQRFAPVCFHLCALPAEPAVHAEPALPAVLGVAALLVLTLLPFYTTSTSRYEFELKPAVHAEPALPAVLGVAALLTARHQHQLVAGAQLLGLLVVQLQRKVVVQSQQRWPQLWMQA